jgi:hypothetical protein
VIILEKIIQNYKTIGLGGILAKTVKKIFSYFYRYINYKKLEEDSSVRPDYESLRSFRNKYQGRRCFVIGNGPSLNTHDLDLLKDEISFGVNSLFYKFESDGFKPSFFMVEDSHVINDNIEEINKFHPHIHRFFPTTYKSLFSDIKDTSFFQMNRGFYEKLSPNYHIPRFSKDFEKRGYCGQSVTMLNLQLAYYMGFTEVYLIGMDFSYNIPESALISGNDIESTEDDENHFHPDYFGKGKKWHDPQLEQVLANYENCKIQYELDGRKIYNATNGGKLEIFPRKDYNEIFNKE